MALKPWPGSAQAARATDSDARAPWHRGRAAAGSKSGRERSVLRRLGTQLVQSVPGLPCDDPKSWQSPGPRAEAETGLTEWPGTPGRGPR
eukprot:746842-Hanusia_phi.AAC.1